MKTKVLRLNEVAEDKSILALNQCRMSGYGVTKESYIAITIQGKTTLKSSEEVIVKAGNNQYENVEFSLSNATYYIYPKKEKTQIELYIQDYSCVTKIVTYSWVLSMDGLLFSNVRTFCVPCVSGVDLVRGVPSVKELVFSTNKEYTNLYAKGDCHLSTDKFSIFVNLERYEDGHNVDTSYYGANVIQGDVSVISNKTIKTFAAFNGYGLYGNIGNADLPNLTTFRINNARFVNGKIEDFAKKCVENGRVSGECRLRLIGTKCTYDGGIVEGDFTIVFDAQYTNGYVIERR